MLLKPGQIVNLRNRLWRIDEYNGVELQASPIDSSEFHKKTFLVELENIRAANLEIINEEKVGNYAFQQLLLRAYKFDLLHGSAPFLSLQKSSVIPYNYQLVPLMMSLEKPQTRILIGDDVGLGKTIEAGLIISEMLQRGYIKRVLFLTPASLKEQWQEALEYFFHIDAKIISSFSRKEYEKELPAGANPWQYFNFCIASLDYAKTPEIKHSILEQQWDLVLIDEVHTCARPHIRNNNTRQMQRYELTKEICDVAPNILFLTATPHNGYSDSFASLLELLNKDIVTYKNQDVIFNKSEGRYNVCQRNRKSLEDWYKSQNLKSPFPSRNQIEVNIKLESEEKLKILLDQVEDYGNFLIDSNKSRKGKEVSVWVALHLQKRAISSPIALQRSLLHRLEKVKAAVEDENDESADILSLNIKDFDVDERSTEEQLSEKLDESAIVPEEITKVEELIKYASLIKVKDDKKFQKLLSEVIPDLFSYDNKIIIFTKYKDTLDYLVKNLNSRDYQLFDLHGDLSFKKRREILLQFEKSSKAILVATDVISEGLNLQRQSSNIVHYELPWNPNRLEQRNGRIDRIGQQKEVVQVRTMIIEDSLDVDILDLLIRKAQTIREDREYSGAYFGDENSLSDMILKAKRRSYKRRKPKFDPNQLTFLEQFDEDSVKKGIAKSFNPFEKEVLDRIRQESFYGEIDISLPEIDKRIKETQNIVGSKEEVEKFVISALKNFNCNIESIGSSFYKFVLNDPRLIVSKYGNTLEPVSFDPEVGLTHPDSIILEVGHPFVKRLINLVKAEFFEKEGAYGRTAYYYSENVKSVMFLYNVLIRFTVGVTKKRVIEELITFGIDYLSKNQINNEHLNQIAPAQTTEKLDEQHFKDLLKAGLKEDFYTSIMNKSIEDKKLKLIQERQELAHKIIRETASDDEAKWVKELQQIELASLDVLSITVVIPKE